MIEKQPFRRYNLEDTPGEVISIRLNDDERKWLNSIKEDLNVKSDAKALKIAARVGRNVIHTMFDRRDWQYLFKKDRAKFKE